MTTEEAQEFEDTVAGIQRGLDAAAEGGEKPLGQYIAEQRAKRAQRDSGPPATITREVAPGVFEITPGWTHRIRPSTDDCAGGFGENSAGAPT